MLGQLFQPERPTDFPEEAKNNMTGKTEERKEESKERNRFEIVELSERAITQLRMPIQAVDEQFAAIVKEHLPSGIGSEYWLG
jgi:hypothetical protein